MKPREVKFLCTRSHKTDNYGRSVQDFSPVIGPVKNIEVYPKYLTTTKKSLAKNSKMFAIKYLNLRHLTV